MNYKKLAIVVLSVAVLVTVLYFIFRKKQPATATTPAAPASGSTGTPAPPAAGKPAAVKNDNFPLNIGSQGENVLRLQKALNRIKPANNLTEDGVFGSVTRSRLLTTVELALSTLPMSEANWNTIMHRANAM